MPEHVCWCCTMWGVVTEATRQDQGMDPGWLCDQCADSSPSACNKRHQKEAA